MDISRFKKAIAGLSVTALVLSQGAAVLAYTDVPRGVWYEDAVDDFVAAGGDMKTVKAAGKLRQEGRGYIVQDGDIINFKFNV